MASNPPSDLSDLSDLLPGATAAIRRQAVLELARLRRKLTAARREMPYFSRSQVFRPTMGRPLAAPVESFVAIMLAKMSGHSVKRAAELLAENEDAASPTLWRLAAMAHGQGIRTNKAFEQWLQRELSETFKSSVTL